jgi:phenylalanine-4-hydroxylase
MPARSLRSFSPEEHHTWRRLFERQAALRGEQVVPQFSAGLDALGIGADRIPELADVNARLRERSGFSGVPVSGLEGPADFFPMLARREFPIGNFIRDAKDLQYTPAPDVFHDLYGHLPFLADPAYADFCQRFGAAASRELERPERLRQFERLFWFTIEFALIRTSRGLRVFGAGIASSQAECRYALSGEPEVADFDLEAIRRREFKIDEMQSLLFAIESERQLYGCLDSFVEGIE